VAGLGNCKELKSGVGTAYWTGLRFCSEKEEIKIDQLSF